MSADVFLFNGRPLDLAKDLINSVQKEASSNHHSLKFGMSAFVICRKSDEEARQELDRLISSLGKSAELRGVDREAVHKKTSSKSRGIGSNGGIAAGLIGSPETVAERMLEFHENSVDLFLLQFHPIFEEIERFSREVMPLLSNVSSPQPAPAPNAPV